MSLGVDPKLALELSEALQKGPTAVSSFTAQQLPPPPKAETKVAAGDGPAATDPENEPPKKKPKAPRPEARDAKHVV